MVFSLLSSLKYFSTCSSSFPWNHGSLILGPLWCACGGFGGGFAMFWLLPFGFGFIPWSDWSLSIEWSLLTLPPTAPSSEVLSGEGDVSLPTAPPAAPSSELFSGEVDGDLLFLVTLRFVLDFLIVSLFWSLSLEVSLSRLSDPCFFSSPELSTSEL